MLGSVLLGQHVIDAGSVLHRVCDGHFGGLVVIREDLLVVGGFPVNEHAADNDQLFALVLGNDARFDGVSNGLGDGILSRAEHLDGLRSALDRNLGDHHRGRLDRQVGRQHGQQVTVPLLLISQRICERSPDGTVFVADQQIDVRNFVAVTGKRFSNIERHRQYSILENQHSV